MTTTTKPSEGALRITRLIAGDNESAIFVNGDHRNFDERGWMTQDELAKIIDRETHAGEMLEALEDAARDCGLEASCASKRNEDHMVKAWSELQHRLDAVIRRARGGE